jgi:hypothetical protein
MPMRELVACSVLLGCGAVEGERLVVCEATPVDVLPNGGFDDLAPAWAEEPAELLCGLPLITPDEGALAACLGNLDGVVEQLRQQVLLPEGASGARLSGKICIDTQETEAVDRDELVFELLDGSTPIATFGRRTNQQGAAGCQFVEFSFDAAVADDPIEATLQLRSSLSASEPTTFYVDSLALEITCGR